MTNNDFFRSNLGIQPKQRLMSAGSFINPVRTYDANEQMRIVESFRGLSAQSDALIDGFIKKKQEEGQAKADMYMTDALLDPNHPEHKKAKEMMNSLKPQAVNLLGVDYWTQQYISRAQAEQLFNKEKAAMELGYNENGDANKSPDEYVEQLGKYRAEIENEVAAYPQMVQKYFYKMPRAELMNAMRDRHIKDVSSQQIELRNNIASNKVYDTLENTVDGLSAVLYNMPDLEDETLSTIQYSAYLSGDTKEEAAMVARLYNWDGVIDKAGKFMPVEQQADILQFRKLSNSPIIDKLLENMRESASAGMTPEQIKQSVYNGFIRMVQDNEDLGDEADILFNILMDRANKDTALQKESGSWGYTKNNNIADDKDAALFDMADIAVKGKSLRQIAVQSAGLKQAEYEAKQIKDRQAVWAFLNDAELAGKISTEDITYKSADYIADKLGMNRVEAGEFIESWKQKRINSITVPVNESHFDQYNKWLHDIHTGKVTTEAQIYKGFERGDFHPRHYEALKEELDKGGLSAKEQRLHNYITNYAKEYIKVKYANFPERMVAMMVQADNLAWDGIKDGTFTSVYDANDYGSKILQIIGAVPGNRELTPNNSTTLDELQTRQQFKDTAQKEIVTPVIDEKTQAARPQMYLYKEETYEDFLNNDVIKKYKELGTPEQVLQEMYNDLRAQSRQSDKEVRKNFITDKLNQGYFDINDLTAMYYEQPDTVNEFMRKELGGEIEIMNGLPVPKEKEQREYFFQMIRQYGDNDKSIMFSLATALETKPYKRKLYAHSKEPFGRYVKGDNVDIAQTK